MKTIISKISKALEKINERMMFVAGIVVAVLLPMLVTRFVVQWTLSALPLFLHWVVLMCLFAALLFWAWLISGNRGHSFFASSYAHGIRWPLLFSIGLLNFSLPCFAALTVMLSRMGLVAFAPTIPPGDGAVPVVQDFYAWHFMNSIPGLDIPKTLHWESPFTYSGKLSGWIVLAFKLTVIVPVIGSFAVWHEIRQEQRGKKKAVA